MTEGARLAGAGPLAAKPHSRSGTASRCRRSCFVFFQDAFSFTSRDVLVDHRVLGARQVLLFKLFAGLEIRVLDRGLLLGRLDRLALVLDRLVGGLTVCCP